MPDRPLIQGRPRTTSENCSEAHRLFTNWNFCAAKFSNHDNRHSPPPPLIICHSCVCRHPPLSLSEGRELLPVMIRFRLAKSTMERFVVSDEEEKEASFCSRHCLVWTIRNTRICKLLPKPLIITVGHGIAETEAAAVKGLCGQW